MAGGVVDGDADGAAVATGPGLTEPGVSVETAGGAGVGVDVGVGVGVDVGVGVRVGVGVGCSPGSVPAVLTLNFSWSANISAPDFFTAFST
ncbi:hypothetical protein D3C73_958350 [compost metagenome]